jgi:hypothetical protein
VKLVLMPQLRVLSVKSGNPITIQDEDIGITWPAALVGFIDIFSRQPILIFFQGWVNVRPMAVNCLDLLHTALSYLGKDWRG